MSQTADARVPAALAAADAAATTLRAAFRQGVAAEVKQATSPIVTEADRAAERAIRAVLRERAPETGILGEEFATENPEASWRWIVDPIDGTIAFACGKPSFTTLIALTEHDVPRLGVIDQPVLRERWIGVPSGTTFVSGGVERPAQTRRGVRLAEARLAATTPAMFEQYPGLVERLTGAVHVTTWGGDAYNVGLLAAGHIDVIVEAGLEPYDYATWRPVVEGAGGIVADWDGHRLERVEGKAALIACGDPALLPEVVALLHS